MVRFTPFLWLSFVLAAVISATAAKTAFSADQVGYETGEERPGGATTSLHPADRSAFKHPSANMAFDRQLDFRLGDAIFRKFWASSPSSTTSSDGLGPLYNARSCQSCHLRDGRGHPPSAGEQASSMVLRLSIPPQTDKEEDLLRSLRAAVIPEPTYGTQLQIFSVQGLLAEGRVSIDYTEVPVSLASGDTISIRKPRYHVSNLNYGPMQQNVMLSPRVAPAMIGLGLLELIPEADILKLADPEDLDGDGIAGVANRVWSPLHDKPMLGRFGWKAGMATITDQTANAFATDIGLSTHLIASSHGDCTTKEPACLSAPTGDDPVEKIEVTKAMLDLVVFYARNLAVPARRQAHAPTVSRGKQLFSEAGCAKCHQPSFVTGSDAAMSEQTRQRIWPYTDLLLHDMGDGLADGRPEGLASGRRWRTPALWGIGLTETVSGHEFLLHDGRARGILEAILWHGGEGEAAKQKVMRMTRQDRADLVAFIRSL